MTAKPSTIPVYWENHLNAFNESKLSQARYGEESELKVHQLGYYKRRQAELNNRHKIPGTGFIKRSQKPSSSIKQPSLCLHLSKKQSIAGITSETLHLVSPLLACLS